MAETAEKLAPLRDLAALAWAEEKQVRKERRMLDLRKDVDQASQWWRTAVGSDGPDPVVAGSVVRPDQFAVHLTVDDALVIEVLRTGEYDKPLPYVVLRCRECHQLVPSAYSTSVTTLADIGAAIETGPDRHTTETLVGGEPARVVCRGGAPLGSDDEPVPTAGDLLLTILNGLVRDAVLEVLDRRETRG